jgi:hypothetical protein
MFTDGHASTGVLGVILVVVTAGCTGGLGGLGGGGGPLSFSADAVSVSDEAVSETNFTQVADKPVTFERSVEVQGQTQEIVMESHMVQLERSYQGASLGHFVVLSLPQVEVLGQQLDIINRLDPMDLISQAQGQSGDIRAQQKIGEESVGILGSQRTVEIHRGTASQNGQETDVRIYLTTFNHQGDTILAVGIVPQTEEQDETAVKTLLGGIQR